MKPLYLSAYILWYLIGCFSSGINQVTIASKSTVDKCHFCNPIYFTNNRLLANCRANQTVSCDFNNHLCGVKINKQDGINLALLNLGCMAKDNCHNKAVLPTHNITFSKEFTAYKCCNSSLCNTIDNLKISKLLLKQANLNEHEEQCRGFTADHKRIYLTDESDNKAIVANGDNLLLEDTKDDQYIEKHAVSSTWYAVFDAVNPYKEVMIISFNRDKNNNFVQGKSNQELMKENNIFFATEKSIYLCDFKLNNINVILNKVVTKDNIRRLFGVVLTDAASKVTHVDGIIEQIKARHNINIPNVYTKTILMDHHNKTQNNTGITTLLSNAVILIPVMTGIGPNYN